MGTGTDDKPSPPPLVPLVAGGSRAPIGTASLWFDEQYNELIICRSDGALRVIKTEPDVEE